MNIVLEFPYPIVLDLVLLNHVIADTLGCQANNSDDEPDLTRLFDWRRGPECTEVDAKTLKAFMCAEVCPILSMIDLPTVTRHVVLIILE